MPHRLFRPVLALAWLLLGLDGNTLAQVPTQGLYREVWTNITGAVVANLTNNAAYPNSPTSSNFMTSGFEVPINVFENYGQRVRGYIFPPQTGDYTLWIASDDASTLYLSTNGEPTNLTIPCYVGTFTGSREWTKLTTQRSNPIRLEAGRSYYVEALMKEGGGGDNLAVKWMLPDGIEEIPIPQSRLRPWGTAIVAPAITQQPTAQAVTEGGAAIFRVRVSNVNTMFYQWQRNGSNIPGANSPDYTNSPAPLADHNVTFRCFLSNSVSTAFSADALLTVQADTAGPRLQSVLNVGLQTIRIVFDEPVATASATLASNYQVSGLSVTSATFGPDTRTIFLTVASPMTYLANYTVTVNNIRDRSTAQNLIAANSQSTFQATEFVPANIGTPPGTGTATFVPGGFDVTAANTDIAGASDQFHFDYQTRTGDFDVKVRVAEFHGADIFSKAGLMARQSLDANSPFAGAFATPSLAGAFHMSRATVAANVSRQGNAPVNYPQTWLRLSRVGNAFTSYLSIDGINWATLGATTITMPATVYVGAALVSHDPASATARFRDWSDTSAGNFISSIATKGEPLAASSRRTGIIISEIMYHPPERGDTNNYEYIELFNTDPVAEDLSGYRFEGAVDFQFPNGAILRPGSFLAVAKNAAAVRAFYGITNILGDYSGSLDNNSGAIRLMNKAGAMILEAQYSDNSGWPLSADGAGHSLVLARPSYGEGNRGAWSASALKGGSPGRMEPIRADIYENLVINEILAHTDEPVVDYIEIYNHGNTAVSLAGCFLTDDRNTNKYRFPDTASIPARGFIAVDQNALGFALDAGGETIFLVASNNVRVIDAITFEGQQNGVAFGRFPDGSAALTALQAQTKGIANAPRTLPEIVINEIMYHPISDEEDDEFIELYNRAGEPIDLSGWKFTDGIDFTFPPGTTIPPNNYLVIAKNAQHLRTNYSQLTTANLLGDYDGSLSDSGERVALSKPDEVVVLNELAQPQTNIIYIVVSEVEYGEGGRWGKWADGGGSSLELIDPRADGNQPSSWADSNEENKSAWTTITHTGVLDLGNGSYPPNQLQMHLQGGGECLVDDVEVLNTSGANLITNPGFESDLLGWVLQGAFKTSAIAPGAGLNGSRALRVSSPVRGDTGANRIYYNLATPPAVGSTMTLRARVRWLKGNPEFLMRFRGNWLEAFGRMDLPTNLGTPGQPNTRSRPNAGPSIFEVAHTPILPTANQAIVVTARATDPDGIATPELRYRVDPGTTYTSLAMNDSGTAGDALANDGIWSATIPGQANNIIVAFFVHAADRAPSPVTATFPPDAPASTCLVRWGETQAPGTIGTYRIWLSADTANTWRTRLVLDNAPLDVTFVYGNYRVIYNVGALYSGSPFHAGYSGPTNSICDYVLNFREDETFLGATDFVLNSVGNLDNDDSAQREQAAFWIMKQLQLPYNHRRHVHVFVNGLRRGKVFEDSQQPNSYFVEGWFNDDNDGELLKIEDWFEFNDTATSFGNVDATLGLFTTTGGQLKTARYRWAWRPRAVKRSANDFNNFFELVRAANDTSSAYTTRVENTADIEEWMRVFGVEHIVGNWDSYGYRRGKNMFTYRPRNGKWTMMAWDIDFVLGSGSDSAQTDIFNSNEPAINRMYNHPPFRRAYLRGIEEAVYGPLQPTQIGRVLDARYDSLIFNGVNAASPAATKSWIADRVVYLQSVLSTVATSFFINSNGGNNFSTNKNFIPISGRAPVGIKTIAVNGFPYPVTWTTPTDWTINIPLTAANNVLNFQGFDLYGRAVSGATDSITVTYTGAFTSPKDVVVINEIMYNSLATNAAFIELYNPSTNGFDLSSNRLDGADFTFPPGSVINPNGYLVIAKNAAFFSAAYGSGIPIVGEFQGSLDNGGERLKLVSPSDELIDAVRYDDDPPWPIAADGSGPSLQLIDPLRDNSRAGNWAASTGAIKYTPGAINNVRVSIPEFPSLWLNEVLPNNTNSITDGAGERDPWIELFNSGATAIDLSAYYLTDDYAALTKWQFPAGLTLNPGQYLIIWADGEPAESAPTAPHTNFRLAPSSGSVALTRIQNGVPAVMDFLNYTLLSPNRSYGSYPDGQAFDRQVFHFVTPREQNDNTALQIPVRINEWMASNTRTLADPADGQFEDWFELFNYGTEPVDLSGYYLTDVLTNQTQFRIPPGYIIPPQGYLLVWADEERGQNASNRIDLHAEFRLSASGESIGLFGADGAQIDAVTFTAQQDDISEGRYPDAGNAPFYQMPTPTPRTANIIPSGNKPPNLTGVIGANIPEQALYQFQAFATDPDPGQTLTFALLNPAPGATIDPITGIFRWTPHETNGPGNFSMTIRVTDNGAPALSRSVTFSLNVIEVNEAPVLGNTPNFTADELVPISLTIPVTDIDLPAQPLFFELASGPVGSSLNPNSGLFEWTPSEQQGPGNFPITIIVRDAANPPKSDTNTFTVTVRDINSAPVLDEIPDQVVFEGETLQLTATGRDLDFPAQTITFSTRGLTGAQIHPTLGTFTFTPIAGQIPSTNFTTIVLTDSSNPAGVTERTFRVIAARANNAPTFTPIPTQTIPEESPFSLTLTAQDSDPSQSVSFTLLTPINGLSLSTNGALAWTPAEIQGPSTNEIQFRLTDDGIPSRTATGSVTIVVTEVNRAPIMPNFQPQTIAVSNTLTLNLTSTDADLPPNALTYSADPGPEGLVVNPATGQLTWTPDARYADTTNTIIVRAFDNGVPSRSDSRIIIVRVSAAPTWRFASVTGTASTSTLYVYTDAPGSVLIDDMRLVAGTSAAVGPNLLPNSDFENVLTPPWQISANLIGSYRTNIARSGASGLFIRATAAGTTRASSIYQDISPALVNGATYTLSYWYVPSTNNLRLITRLSSSALNLSQSIFEPSAPPTIIIAPALLATGELQLTWPTRAGITYRVYQRTNMDPAGAWQRITPDIVATGPTATYRTPLAPDIRFFLIEALP